MAITGGVEVVELQRLVRDALEWSKQINKALYLFGQDAEVMFASHSWPRWGNERIQEVMRSQRDTYAHLNNGVLHLANQGVTINQVHNVYEVPESLQQQWSVRSYHGSVEHNSRAVVNRYLGYWDGNPTTLIPLSPEDSAPLYVQMMGGAEKIIAKGKELYDLGKYRHAQEILNKLVYAEPQNQQAKDLLADIFEQIGYQQESPSVRNSFIAAALELRSGIPTGASPKSAGPDVIRAMTTELWLDFLAVRLDSAKAQDKTFKINLVTPDNGEQFVVELSNSTLTFEVTVSDGTNTSADTVTITVNDEKNAPYAEAGANQRGDESDGVTLDATGNIDFSNNASTFNALDVQSDNRISVNQNIVTDAGSLSLDGDADNAADTIGQPDHLGGQSAQLAEKDHRNIPTGGKTGHHDGGLLKENRDNRAHRAGSDG